MDTADWARIDRSTAGLERCDAFEVEVPNSQDWTTALVILTGSKFLVLRRKLRPTV